ncbi:alpha/beta hydrolase [Undibacterium sp.]|jgi:pimeloyl-ACP methyl ester carboxylesterase|uniref:alpha/beta fold hydrolase n=1 Tax=Undibacterium sp. TaxID=1914977 RepID=UPI002C08BA82|nr:alpha/beta hydrolase [Undibacterium sp.]HTD06028.1 alpha/beta hydrolase [Undibacterium sp.]
MTNTLTGCALRTLSAAALVTAALASPGSAMAQSVKYSKGSTSDATLVKSLPGFSNATAQVNGTTIHYVIGGKGEPLVLLPGWPETWWSFHKIMPELAQHYQVIVVDLRGMGSSAKPAVGYDKKNMAKDIHELLEKLGHDKAYIAGHDIGAQVAWSFAANYPQSTEKLVMMDVPHSDEGLYSWPLVPALNTFGDKIDENHAFAWWFAFHQVKGLPEKMLAGRAHLEQEWFFTYLMKDESALSPVDRSVYANAYNSADAIRAGNAWYQAFPQDIADQKSYQKLTMPVLGLAGPGYGWLNASLTAKATNAHTIHMDSGHFMQEEAQQETTRLMLDFLK